MEEKVQLGRSKELFYVFGQCQPEMESLSKIETQNLDAHAALLLPCKNLRLLEDKLVCLT